jgi:hypothetical protein
MQQTLQERVLAYVVIIFVLIAFFYYQRPSVLVLISFSATEGWELQWPATGIETPISAYPERKRAKCGMATELHALGVLLGPFPEELLANQLCSASILRINISPRNCNPHNEGSGGWQCGMSGWTRSSGGCSAWRVSWICAEVLHISFIHPARISIRLI